MGQNAHMGMRSLIILLRKLFLSVWSRQKVESNLNYFSCGKFQYNQSNWIIFVSAELLLFLSSQSCVQFCMRYHLE